MSPVDAVSSTFMASASPSRNFCDDEELISNNWTDVYSVGKQLFNFNEMRGKKRRKEPQESFSNEKRLSCPSLQLVCKNMHAVSLPPM